jgi:hypothetical protein
MPLWGQFLDHRGQVKESMRGPFLSALASQSSLAHLEDCFPLQPIAVQASARHFYDAYAV